MLTIKRETFTKHFNTDRQLLLLIYFKALRVTSRIKMYNDTGVGFSGLVTLKNEA